MQNRSVRGRKLVHAKSFHSRTNRIWVHQGLGLTPTHASSTGTSATQPMETILVQINPSG